MSDDMGINPALAPVGDILVVAHPCLRFEDLLLLDKRALVREVFRAPSAELPAVADGNYATSACQLDVFRSALVAPLHALYVAAFDHTCSEAYLRPTIAYCVQCGKRRHASRRRCAKCKRRSR